MNNASAHQLACRHVQEASRETGKARRRPHATLLCSRAPLLLGRGPPAPACRGQRLRKRSGAASSNSCEQYSAGGTGARPGSGLSHRHVWAQAGLHASSNCPTDGALMNWDASACGSHPEAVARRWRPARQVARRTHLTDQREDMCSGCSPVGVRVPPSQLWRAEIVPRCCCTAGVQERSPWTAPAWPTRHEQAMQVLVVRVISS